MDGNNIDYSRFNTGREIKISDLVEEIIRRLWFVVVLAVICAALLAGYKYVDDKNSAQTSGEEDLYEDIASSLDEEEISEVESLIALNQMLQDQTEYMENSIKMQINAYAEDRVTLQFAVNGAYADASAFADSMSSYVNSGSLSAELSGLYPDIDMNYLAELIGISSYDDSTSYAVYGDNTETSIVVVIYVIHLSSEECEELADNVYEAVCAYAQNISSEFGSAKLSLVNRSSSVYIDSSLISYKSTKTDAIDSIRSDIQDLTEEMSDAQLAAASGSDYSSETEENSSEEVTAVSIDIKYVIVGLLIGIAVAVVLIILRVVLSGTLNNSDELQKTFNICLFGEVDIYEKKNPLISLWRKVTGKRKKPDVDASKALVLENITGFCRGKNITAIAFAGTMKDLGGNKYISELAANLKNSGIETEVVTDILTSPGQTDRLSGYEYVIIAERVGKSGYEEICECVKKILERGKIIAGAVTLK